MYWLMAVAPFNTKKIAHNADGYAMPDIEQLASYPKAMAGSVIADVTAPKGKFVFALSGWLLN